MGAGPGNSAKAPDELWVFADRIPSLPRMHLHDQGEADARKPRDKRKPKAALKVKLEDVRAGLGFFFHFSVEAP